MPTVARTGFPSSLPFSRSATARLATPRRGDGGAWPSAARNLWSAGATGNLGPAQGRVSTLRPQASPPTRCGHDEPVTPPQDELPLRRRTYRPCSRSASRGPLGPPAVDRDPAPWRSVRRASPFDSRQAAAHQGATRSSPRPRRRVEHEVGTSAATASSPARRGSSGPPKRTAAPARAGGRARRGPGRGQLGGQLALGQATLGACVRGHELVDLGPRAAG